MTVFEYSKKTNFQSLCNETLSESNFKSGSVPGNHNNVKFESNYLDLYLCFVVAVFLYYVLFISVTIQIHKYNCGRLQYDICLESF